MASHSHVAPGSFAVMLREQGLRLRWEGRAHEALETFTLVTNHIIPNANYVTLKSVIKGHPV